MNRFFALTNDKLIELSLRSCLVVRTNKGEGRRREIRRVERGKKIERKGKFNSFSVWSGILGEKIHDVYGL